jgi:hypothetical protein
MQHRAKYWRAVQAAFVVAMSLLSTNGPAVADPGDIVAHGGRRTTVFDDVGRICERGCPSFVRFTGDDEKFINRAGSPLGKRRGQPQWTSSVDYHAAQRRDDASDARRFPRTDGSSSVTRGQADGAVVRIREATVTPAAVHRGDTCVIATDYSLVSLDGATELEIAEEWHVRYVPAGADIRRLRGAPPDLSVYAIKQRRRPGGWRVAVTIGVPENARPGAYRVDFYLNTGTHQDRRNVEFVVD